MAKMMDVTAEIRLQRDCDCHAGPAPSLSLSPSSAVRDPSAML